jgi:AcrR family transcriptional regulator
MPAMTDVSASASAGRAYRGASAQSRVAERRGRLIGAAERLYAQLGYRNVSVKAICTEAGLTERYFYESFANGEDLLAATYGAAVQRVLSEVEAAALQGGSVGSSGRLRAGLSCFFQTLQRTPDAARVFLLETSGVSARVDAVRNAAIASFGRLLMGCPAELATDVQLDLLTVAVVGGLFALSIRWVGGGFAEPLDSVVACAERLCAALP